jgi:lactoylglutathione lyase
MVTDTSGAAKLGYRAATGTIGRLMKLDHVTLLVSSLETSAPYYEHLLPLLGFTKLRNYVWTDGNGFYFQFLQARPGTVAYERYGAGMNHLGFGATSPDHVLGIREAMQKAGFAVPEVQHLGGATALFMKDPDGIRFEVTYYPPGMSVVD